MIMILNPGLTYYDYRERSVQRGNFITKLGREYSQIFKSNGRSPRIEIKGFLRATSASSSSIVMIINFVLKRVG